MNIIVFQLNKSLPLQLLMTFIIILLTLNSFIIHKIKMSRRTSQDFEKPSSPPLVADIACLLTREANICLHLDLSKFKIYPCTIKEPHIPKRCPFYHDYKRDRRRPSSGYSSEMCAYILNEKDCPYGESCTNAHNRVEEFYHSSKYRTRFCTCYPDNLSACEYGDFCCFAHSELELNIDLLHLMEKDTDFYMFHYKTSWCPFNEENHSRDQCVYAHNWQDYRRKPHIIKYQKEQCRNWCVSKVLNSYYEGCINGMKCQYSHGWKEQEFHPTNYKMSSCRQGEACTKAHCPFYHSEKDRRYPLSSGFVVAPKNRIVGFPSQGLENPHLARKTDGKFSPPPVPEPITYVGSPMSQMPYGTFSGVLPPPIRREPSPTDYYMAQPQMYPRVSPPISPHYYSPPSASPCFGPHFPLQNFSPPTTTIYRGFATKSPPSKKLQVQGKLTTTAAPFIPSFETKNQKKKERFTKRAEAIESIMENISTGIPKLNKGMLQGFSLPVDEEEQARAREEEQIRLFLKENKLLHLLPKLGKFTESALLSITEAKMDQLEIAGDDKKSLAEAVDKTRSTRQTAFANIQEFD